MALNPFFRQEVASEQRLVQDLVNEHLRMYGQEVYYLPRKYLGTESIMKENVLSKFDDAYPIEAYMVNVEGFQGSGDLLTKFGIRVTDDVTFIISRERFEDYISNIATAINESEDLRRGVVTDRPIEGDLIYFPLTDSLFEIKFVEHENPFYQLGSLYTYELKCELFEYEQEIFDTEIAEIDDNVAEIGYVVTLKLSDSGTATSSVAGIATGAVNELVLINDGYGYSSTPIVSISTSPNGSSLANATAVAITTIGYGQTTYSVQSLKITNPGFGYTQAPTVTFIGDGNGTEARANIGTTGVVNIISLSGGSEYTEVPNVAITTSPVGLSSANATGEVLVSAAGTVYGFRFSNAGFGYTLAPTIAIDSPTQRRVATGRVGYTTAGVGTVTNVSITDPGFGYTVAPSITISDPSGFRAGVITSSVGIGSTLLSLSIGYSGASYASAPTITFSTPSGYRTGIITAGVGIGTTINSVTVVNPGAYFGSVPTLSITGPASVDYADAAPGIGSTAVLLAQINTSGIITGVQIVSPGYGYNTTDILSVSISGGISTGSATVFIDSVADEGLISTFTDDSSEEEGRTPGSYPTLSALGGSGSGATFEVIVSDASNGRLAAAATFANAVGGGTSISLAGFTTTGVDATGSTINDALFDVFRDGAGSISTVTVNTRGTGYVAGEILTIAASVTGGLTDYLITLESNDIDVVGGPVTVLLENSGINYAVSDELTLPSANIGGGSSITVTVSTIETGVSGIITGTLITDPGFGHTTPPSVLLVGGIGTATGTSTINSSGEVTGVTFTNVGTGYTTRPTITFSTPNNPINVGNFVYGEVITGQSGLATALVKTWSAETLTLETYAVSGDFRNGELLVGSANTITTGNPSFVTAAYFIDEVIYENNDSSGVDAYEQNTEIQDAATDVEGIVDWTETNPFGTF